LNGRMDNEEEQQRRSRNFRNIFLLIVAVIFAVILINQFVLNPESSARDITYSELVKLVDTTIQNEACAAKSEALPPATGCLIEMKAQGLQLSGKMDVLAQNESKEPSRKKINFRSYALTEKSIDEINDKLYKAGRHDIRIVGEPVNDSRAIWTTIVFTVLPFIVIIFLWYMMLRRMQGDGGGALSFGRSQAKLVNKEYSKVTFADVAGIDEVKEEVQEIVEYLKEPTKFSSLGAQIPKGVLLVGPPGTGKTLLARAIAGEADVSFFSLSGSDFVEMFVGVGAARVRDLFRRAKEEAKGKRGVIIFIDEIDAVGRKRGAGIGGGHDEREQTLNQLLSEMDGFEKNEHVIIIAATNRPDILDMALLRPGRFDRKITVPPPDLKGREEILRVHTKNKKLPKDIELKILARRTPGFVGADLENLCNEAALLAARRNKKEITIKEFEDSIDRVIAGVERKGRLISEDEKIKIAYHEAGHALVGKLLPKADPVHRISIVPRGEALGYTLSLPMEDKYLYTKEELLDKLTGILGGRAAEEVIFSEITTGAYDDLKKATEIAKRMVVSYGMSEQIGPINLGQENGNVFLGVDLILNRDHSEQMSAIVDQEIKSLVETCYVRARDLLQRNKERLHRLAKRLLEVEVIEGEQLDQLLQDHVSPQPA
jgi:cell division protease FtsH